MSDISYETWHADDINPVPWNPRVDLVPGDAEWHQIEHSLEAFGLVVPLVVNRRTNNLISGHQRYAVLTHRGITDIPVTVVDLDDDDEKALNLAMNAVRGLWDEEALAGILDYLADVGLAHLTGFPSQELAKLTGALAAEFTPDPDTPLVAPTSTSAPTPTDTAQATDDEIATPVVVCPNCGSEQPA